MRYGGRAGALSAGRGAVSSSLGAIAAPAHLLPAPVAGQDPGAPPGGAALGIRPRAGPPLRPPPPEDAPPPPAAAARGGRKCWGVFVRLGVIIIIFKIVNTK